MIIGIHQGVVPLFPSQQLDGPVGDDLVGVHVETGARAPLDGIHDEGLVELARRNLVTGADDGVRHPFVQQADLIVGDGRRLFDLGNGVDDLRVHGQPRDVKVFRRPQGLYAVIHVLGHRPLSNRVVLGTIDRLDRRHKNPSMKL